MKSMNLRSLLFLMPLLVGGYRGRILTLYIR